MINNPIGLNIDYIKGTRNVLANKSSRLYYNLSTPPSFFSLMQEFPQIKLWNIFLPSPKLLSALYSALLEEHEPRSCLPKMLGYFVSGKTLYHVPRGHETGKQRCFKRLHQTHSQHYNGLLYCASSFWLNSSVSLHLDRHDQKIFQGCHESLYFVSSHDPYSK